MSDEQPRKDKAGRGAAILAWLKQRAQAANLKRAITNAAVSRAVAAAIAAVAVGGSVVATSSIVAERRVEDAIGVGLEDRVAALEELLAKQVADLDAVAADLDDRVEKLAGLLTATDFINDTAVERLGMEVAALTDALNAQANRVATTTAELDAATTDLANVIANQNVLGLRSEEQAYAMDTLAAGLDTVGVVADGARRTAIAAADAAREAGDLAATALDAADAVAERVAALADRVDDVAQEVADAAARVDEVADDVDELGDRVDGLASDLDALAAQVADHERRLRAEEAEQPLIDSGPAIQSDTLPGEGTICFPGPSYFGTIRLDGSQEWWIAVTVAFDWQADHRGGPVRVELRDGDDPTISRGVGHRQFAAGTYTHVFRSTPGVSDYAVRFFCETGRTWNRQVSYVAYPTGESA